MAFFAFHLNGHGPELVRIGSIRGELITAMSAAELKKKILENRDNLYTELDKIPFYVIPELFIAAPLKNIPIPIPLGTCG